MPNPPNGTSHMNFQLQLGKHVSRESGVASAGARARPRPAARLHVQRGGETLETLQYNVPSPSSCRLRVM